MSVRYRGFVSSHLSIPATSAMLSVLDDLAEPLHPLGAFLNLVEVPVLHVEPVVQMPAKILDLAGHEPDFLQHHRDQRKRCADHTLAA